MYYAKARVGGLLAGSGGRCYVRMPPQKRLPGERGDDVLSQIQPKHFHQGDPGMPGEKARRCGDCAVNARRDKDIHRQTA